MGQDERRLGPRPRHAAHVQVMNNRRRAAGRNGRSAAAARVAAATGPPTCRNGEVGERFPISRACDCGRRRRRGAVRHAANEYYVIEGAGKVYGMAGAEKAVATLGMRGGQDPTASLQAGGDKNELMIGVHDLAQGIRRRSRGACPARHHHVDRRGRVRHHRRPSGSGSPRSCTSRLPRSADQRPLRPERTRRVDAAADESPGSATKRSASFPGLHLLGAHGRRLRTSSSLCSTRGKASSRLRSAATGRWRRSRQWHH